ncbi:hypothetical protein OIU84_012541 [Salix udensis]|uniref:Uncharacterized protein n=1 Tax=Salix udensis TaxID=889485 RepID=A0AAD6JG16_9ROSI|nr:hypothetical protein OIU84_012541 [Salix udensis]
MILRSESSQSLNFSMPNAGINGVKFEISWKQSLNMNNLIFACCCQVPEYARGSDLWNKCRQDKMMGSDKDKAGLDVRWWVISSSKPWRKLISEKGHKDKRSKKTVEFS